MRAILMAVTIAVSLVGCAAQTVTREEYLSRVKSSYDVILDPILRENPEIAYCYGYSDDKFKGKMSAIHDEVLDLVVDEYPVVMTIRDVESLSTRVGHISYLKYTKRSIDDFDFTGLSHDQIRICEKVKKDAIVYSKVRTKGD